MPKTQPSFSGVSHCARTTQDEPPPGESGTSSQSHPGLHKHWPKHHRSLSPGLLCLSTRSPCIPGNMISHNRHAPFLSTEFRPSVQSPHSLRTPTVYSVISPCCTQLPSMPSLPTHTDSVSPLEQVSCWLCRHQEG